MPSRRPRLASAARRSGTAAAAREARRSGTTAAAREARGSGTAIATGRPQKGDTYYQAHLMVDSHVNEDRIDEEGQTLVPVVVDGNFTRQQDRHHPDYWIHQFLDSKYITDDEEK